jgi:hypothetical protein
MKSVSIFPIFSHVTVSFAGMAVLAVIDQAEAGKGITASGSRTYSAHVRRAGQGRFQESLRHAVRERLQSVSPRLGVPPQGRGQGRHPRLA